MSYLYMQTVGKNTQRSLKKPKKIPPEIRKEQLSRQELFLGEDGMSRLKEARVCVVGVGGVGSHTVALLARSGLGHLRFIDFDQVSLSSLNRHACATIEDVGISKVQCLYKHCRAICPDPTHLQMEAINAMYTKDTAAELLDDHEWTFVVDAIDDTPTKAALLAHCYRRNIRVVSCMGAGGKSDPTRLALCDLKSASKDPLATKLRQELRHCLPDKKEAAILYDDMEKLTVLYNSEKVVMKLADLTPMQKEIGASNFGAVDGMRIRIMPVLGSMPALMGQALAAVVVTRVAGKPIRQPFAGEASGKNVTNKFWQSLANREEKWRDRVMREAGLTEVPRSDDIQDENKGCWVNLETKDISFHTSPTRTGLWFGPCQIYKEDVDFVLQLWRNRCAVTQQKLGHPLVLVRWDMTKPSHVDNLVLMTASAVKKYYNEDALQDCWASLPDDIATNIRRCLANVDEDGL